jgi:putative peptidoglycan lipid II flippase
MALSTALAAWFNVAVLAVLLRRRGFFVMDQRLMARLPRILAASAVMAAALWAGQRTLWPLADGQLAALGLLVALVTGGLTVYGLAAQLLGAARLSDIRGMMRRSK